MKIFFTIMMLFFFMIQPLAFGESNFEDFTNYGESSTRINSSSATNPVVVVQNNGGIASKSITVQIFSSSSTLSGKLQGLISNPKAPTNTNDTKLTSPMWIDIENGDFTGDCFLPIIAPITHIRLVLSAGSCKGRVLFQ